MLSRALTSMGGAPMQQRTSTTQRRSIGRGASLLITRTLSCSGKWEGTVRVPLADLIRCERCAVPGRHPRCVRHRLLGVVRWAWQAGEGCTTSSTFAGVRCSAVSVSTIISLMLLTTTRVTLRAAASTKLEWGDCRGGSLTSDCPRPLASLHPQIIPDDERPCSGDYTHS